MCFPYNGTLHLGGAQLPALVDYFLPPFFFAGCSTFQRRMHSMGKFPRSSLQPQPTVSPRPCATHSHVHPMHP